MSDAQEFMNDMGNVWGFHHSGTFDSNSFHFVMKMLHTNVKYNAKYSLDEIHFQNWKNNKKGVSKNDVFRKKYLFLVYFWYECNI